MSDIVERLRTVVSDLADEAADEIELMRERIDKLKELNKVIGDHANNLVETVLKQDERIEELEKDCLADNQRETEYTMSDELYEEIDHPGSIVTWTFYIDDPEGERRLRECLDAPKVLRAVEDFERKIHRILDDEKDPEVWVQLNGYGALNRARDILFECFDHNDVTVPGWE